MALDHRVLIGRTDALGQIDAAAQRRLDPHAVTVTGEAGIGKSRLLEHALENLRAHGWQVLLGGCVEVSGEPIPYAPIAGALRLLRRDLDRADPVSAEIDIMLGPGASDSPRDITELFELTLSIVQQLADRGPVVFALEDLHWADPGTLDLVSFLLRTLDGPVLALLTYRNEDFQRTPALTQLTESLVRSRQVTRVELPRLSREEVAELGRRVLGVRTAGPALDRLYERSGGNPFIAEELLVAGSDGDVPSSVHDILLARAAQIDSDAEHLVRVTALIGRAVGHDLLADACQLDEGHLAMAVRQAVGSGLLVVDVEREEYAFRHVLTQEAVRQRILPAERRRLHAAIAAALARDPEVATSASLATEWAAHVASTGDRVAAIPALLSAARLSAEAFAYTASWRQYHRALELLDQVDANLGVDLREVLAAAADVARWTGELETAVELAARATELSTTDHERATIAESVGRYYVDAGRFADAEAAFTSAAALAAGVDDTALHARIAVSSARLFMLTGRYQQAVPQARAALELAAAVGAAGEQGRAYTALGMSEVLLGSVDDGLAHVRAGHELVYEHGDLDDKRRADSNLSFALLMAGHTSEACEVGVNGLATMRRYGLAAANGGALTSNTIVLLRVSGRWDEADQLCDEIEERGGLPKGMALRIALSRTELEIARGRFDLAAGHLESARELAVASPEVSGDLALARAAIAIGRAEHDAATHAVDEALTLQDESERLAVRTALLALRVEAELADEIRSPRRDAEVAPRIAQLHEMLATAGDHSRSPEVQGYTLTGHAEHSRAVRRSDPALWSAAAERWEQIERQRGLAYCLFRLGEAKLLKRRTAAAKADLARAHRIALDIGATPIAEAVEHLTVRAGIGFDDVLAADRDRADRGPRLTKRETQILEQLAEGRRNKEIAEDLFVSPRTVGVHVSNILSKLGVRTRSEAVRAARELRLLT